MKSSLISKLEKKMLIPLAAGVLAAGTLFAQDTTFYAPKDSTGYSRIYSIDYSTIKQGKEQGGEDAINASDRTSKKRAEFILRVKMFSNLGYAYGETIEPYANWRSQFNPPSDNEILEYVRNRPHFDFGFELDPSIMFGDGRIEIGIPIRYSLKNLMEYDYGSVIVKWWDPVLLNETAVQKITPCVGLEASIALENSSRQPATSLFCSYDYTGTYLDLRLLVSKCKITYRNCKGVDVYGGTNYSVPLSENVVYNWTPRIEAGITWKGKPYTYTGDPIPLPVSTGIYFDSITKGRFEAGWYFNFGL